MRINKRKFLVSHLFAATHEWRNHSSLVRGLRAARELTGRDLESGRCLEGQSHGSWLGTLGYMAILEQIGHCFRPRKLSRTPHRRNGIIDALTYFSRLTVDEMNAIYALRCGFAHDYSLYNINHKESSLMHQFAVSQGNIPKRVVKLPRIKWNGDFKKKTRKNQTVINLEKFGDLVEKIYQRLLALFRRRQLDIAFAGGPDELISRYQIWTQGYRFVDA